PLLDNSGSADLDPARGQAARRGPRASLASAARQRDQRAPRALPGGLVGGPRRPAGLRRVAERRGDERRGERRRRPWSAPRGELEQRAILHAAAERGQAQRRAAAAGGGEREHA